MAKGCKAASDALDAFQVLDRTHPDDGINLLGVFLDPSLGYDKAEKHATGDTKNAFLGVEPRSRANVCSRSVTN
jgi:hypothetical protein